MEPKIGIKFEFLAITYEILYIDYSRRLSQLVNIADGNNFSYNLFDLIGLLKDNRTKIIREDKQLEFEF